MVTVGWAIAVADAASATRAAATQRVAMAIKNLRGMQSLDPGGGTLDCHSPGTRMVKRRRTRPSRNASWIMKNAAKSMTWRRYLVAGVGFEPTTFRL